MILLVGIFLHACDFDTCYGVMLCFLEYLEVWILALRFIHQQRISIYPGFSCLLLMRILPSVRYKTFLLSLYGHLYWPGPCKSFLQIPQSRSLWRSTQTGNSQISKALDPQPSLLHSPATSADFLLFSTSWGSQETHKSQRSCLLTVSWVNCSLLLGVRASEMLLSAPCQLFCEPSSALLMVPCLRHDVLRIVFLRRDVILPSLVLPSRRLALWRAGEGFGAFQYSCIC